MAEPLAESDHSHPKAGRAAPTTVCIPCMAGEVGESHALCRDRAICRCACNMTAPPVAEARRSSCGGSGRVVDCDQGDIEADCPTCRPDVRTPPEQKTGDQP